MTAIIFLGPLVVCFIIAIVQDSRYTRFMNGDLDYPNFDAEVLEISEDYLLVNVQSTYPEVYKDVDLAIVSLKSEHIFFVEYGIKKGDRINANHDDTVIKVGDIAVIDDVYAIVETSK